MDSEEINYLSVLNTDNLDTIDINKECIDEIIQTITYTLNKLNINLEGKSVYYQRNSNKISILAIKLADGDDQDVSNYMFNGGDARSFEHFNSCDVFLHADAKVGQKAMNIANMISRNIVEFFNKMEKYYLDNGMVDTEVSFRIPLGEDFKKETSQDNGVRSLIKRFFRSKK